MPSLDVRSRGFGCTVFGDECTRMARFPKKFARPRVAAIRTGNVSIRPSVHQTGDSDTTSRGGDWCPAADSPIPRTNSARPVRRALSASSFQPSARGCEVPAARLRPSYRSTTLVEVSVLAKSIESSRVRTATGAAGRVSESNPRALLPLLAAGSGKLVAAERHAFCIAFRKTCVSWSREFLYSTRSSQLAGWRTIFRH
jgi:hypothetical protein